MERQVRELVARGHMDLEHSICGVFPLVGLGDAHLLLHPRMRAVREELALSIERKLSLDLTLRRGRAWFYYYQGWRFRRADVSCALYTLVPFEERSEWPAAGEGNVTVTVTAS